jgi:capsular polysaccharide biosynthesis protein
MQDTRYLEKLAASWKRLLLFGAAAALFGVLASLVFPLEYSSSMRLLIIQKQLAETDPYTAIKGAERTSDNLAQIIYTTSFYDKVMAAKFNIDKGYFKADERKRRDQWSKMIETSVTRESGLLVITVYHKDPEQATQIARAVAFVLTTEGWQYVGGDLQVKLVDDPLQSRWPTRPNLPGNAVTGFVLGTVLGAALVLRERKKGIFGGLGQD